MLPAFLTTILFSISAVSATRTARLLGGTEANFWRLVLAMILLAIWAHAVGVGLAGNAFAFFFLSGCIGFGIGDVALFQALPRLGSRLTVLLVHCFAAPFAALTEWLWLGTRMTPVEMLAGLTILTGVAIAIAPGGNFKIPRQYLLPGVLFGILAAYGQGFGAVLSRKAYEVATLSGENIDGITAAYQRIVGGVMVSGMFLLLVKRREVWGALAGGPGLDAAARLRRRAQWRENWPWIVLNGVAGPALGVSCFQWALKTSPTGVVLPIVALTPLVVIPFTRYMEGEPLNARSLIGGVLAVIGAVALTLAT